MNCPKCSIEMLAGRVHIGGGPSNLLFGDGSFGNLTFRTEGWRDHVMQDTSDVLPAHYCDKCGVVTVETRRIGLSTLEN